MYEDSITQASLKTAVTVFISPNETVNVSTIKKLKPNYLMVGNGTMNKYKIYGIDLLTELVNSTKAEQFLLLAIKNGIGYESGYSPIVKVVGANHYQQKQIAEGYKSLLARDLVRRVKKTYYMINPNALIPLDYEQAMLDWEQCAPKLV